MSPLSSFSSSPNGVLASQVNVALTDLPHGHILFLLPGLLICLLPLLTYTRPPVLSEIVIFPTKFSLTSLNISKPLWQFDIASCFSLFKIYFRERENTSGGEGQRETEKILSRLHAQRGARHGARSHDPGLMTWAQIKSWLLNRLSHPGTPCLVSLISIFHRFVKSAPVLWAP